MWLIQQLSLSFHQPKNNLIRPNNITFDNLPIMDDSQSTKSSPFQNLTLNRRSLRKIQNKQANLETRSKANALQLCKMILSDSCGTDEILAMIYWFHYYTSFRNLMQVVVDQVGKYQALWGGEQKKEKKLFA